MGQNCRKCGAPLEPEASFCTVCGAAVHDRQESGISDASKAKNRKKAGIIMGCLAGSAAVIVLLAVVLIGRPWDKKAVLESSPEFVVETGSGNGNGNDQKGEIYVQSKGEDETGESGSSQTSLESRSESESENAAAEKNDKTVGSQTILPANFTFSDEEWNRLSYAGAWLAALLSDDELAGGTAFEVGNMTKPSLERYVMALMTNIYADDETYSRDREFEENLGLVGDGKNYIAYSKKTVDVLLGNTLGYAPETSLIENGSASGDGMSFDGENYYWEDREYPVVYELRFCGCEVEDNLAVTEAELMASNGSGYYPSGIYKIWWQKDDKSNLGYVIIRIQKVFEAAPQSVQAEASSTLISYERADKYQVSNVLDHDLSTAWVEGVNGYGEGESILLTFDTAQALHGIRICGGYRKNAATYQENGRVTSYRLEFSDGTVMDVNMGDYPSDGMLGKAPAGVMGWETVLSTDGREWQGWDSLKSGMDYISFGKAVTTDYVRLTILAVAPGTVYEDTCITEIEVY